MDKASATDFVKKILPLFLTMICAALMMIYFYPWLASQYPSNSVTFWVYIGGAIFVLLVLDLGVFTQLINFILGS